MWRRWIIRTFMLALLALCVAAWALSYQRAVGISMQIGGSLHNAGMEWGRLAYSRFPAPAAVPLSNLFYKPASSVWESFENRNPNHWVGFCFDSTGSTLLITIPFWFVFLMLTLLLLLAWRKTRPTPITRAFPIEPAKTAEPKP